MSAVNEIMSVLQSKLVDPSKMKGTTAVFQFDLGDAGAFFVNFNDGAATVSEGKADNPNITISMSADDFQSMLSGALNPMMAFMSGKIKIAGDMGLAMKLQSLLG
ncbi:MAG: SCP2 sterol-binding domain-containing protein [Desulfurispora sp.]|uniref:SCP2 sterol-binding domain-containing protein n=1 Tax=Desulfurispora sp. TaxID=3014275 RepID=UPI00404B5B12